MANDFYKQEGYDHTKYTTNQMVYIKSGIIRGLDVSIYDKVEYHEYIMHLVFEILSRKINVDVTPLLNPKLTDWQLDIVHAAIITYYVNAKLFSIYDKFSERFMSNIVTVMHTQKIKYNIS